MLFDKDFIWGVATAAYQIEGAENEDGRGESIWDSKFTQGKILGDMNGEIACDHYHRYKEDIELLKELGIKNYRFSISWTRIFPSGTGEVNLKGVEFYKNLVNRLIAADITPWVTIYHWDLPRKLYEQGGFLNGEISDWFAKYAAKVVEIFGDKVSNYIIFNEPQCVVEAGHFAGDHAPFLRLTRKETFTVAHNVLLCIGKAEKAMRKAANHKLNIGISPCFTPMMPKNKADEAAAEKYNFSPSGDFWDGCFFTDAVIKGEFTDEYKEWFKKYDYYPSAEDMKIIKSNLDFFGLNMYRGFYVENAENGMKRVGESPNDMITAMEWQVTPEAAEYVAKYYHERYGLPIIFAENGIALTEWKTLNGDIPDDMRIDYMKRHIAKIAEVAEKYNVKGYFYWSFMDNFEWALGYSKRFGLVYVDYETQERTPKKSSYWYKKVIETNGENLD